MADNIEILKRLAQQVRNATQEGENTAERVGRVLIGIIENLGKVDISELQNYFLRKDQADATNFLLKLLGGAEFGEFIDSMLAGKGAGIFPDGRMQAERMEVRGAFIAMESIFNRLFFQEGNVTYSESGTIERFELLEDGTYDLYLRRRWDNDITAFRDQDICFGSVNNLTTVGEYYDSWFRVLNVMQAENKLNVILYPDGEVPGNKNNPPAVGMVITRRGNAVYEERMGYWYISSYEGCICMLDGVTKPVIETNNYSIIIGKLKRLDIFTNLPINYLHSYVYCRGIAIQDLMRINYEGIPVLQLNDRGNWSAEIAVGPNPYRVGKEYVDTVWHYGCRWKCLLTGTADEPQYSCTGWAMIEGNPNLSADIFCADGFEYIYHPEWRVEWEVRAELYNRDVTEHIRDEDVSWTRDTGDVTEDNAWAIKRADAGKVLVLTVDDLGPEPDKVRTVTYTATLLLRDGSTVKDAIATKTLY